MVKLVDALDSKSSDPKGRVGSSPTSGTRTFYKLLFLKQLFSFLKPSKQPIPSTYTTLLHRFDPKIPLLPYLLPCVAGREKGGMAVESLYQIAKLLGPKPILVLLQAKRSEGH